MKKTIQTPKAPAAIGTYSQAVENAGIVYTSGQIAINPETSKMVENDFSKQAHQVFKNLQAVAIAANTSLQNTLKLTIYLQDLANFTTLNEIMAQYFAQPYPARAAVEVAALPKNAMIEIDAIITVK